MIRQLPPRALPITQRQNQLFEIGIYGEQQLVRPSAFVRVVEDCQRIAATSLSTFEEPNRSAAVMAKQSAQFRLPKRDPRANIFTRNREFRSATKTKGIKITSLIGVI